MNHAGEEKMKMNAKLREHAESLIANIKNDWLPYYTYVEEETGLSRIELITHLLKAEVQALYRGLAKQNEKAAPILDKLREDMAEDEEWQS